MQTRVICNTRGNDEGREGLATYMIGGRGSMDQAAARLFALQHPEAFGQLMDILVEASTRYLVAQFRAGADVVQLFESWAQKPISVFSGAKPAFTRSSA